MDEMEAAAAAAVDGLDEYKMAADRCRSLLVSYTNYCATRRPRIVVVGAARAGDADSVNADWHTCVWECFGLSTSP